MDYNTIIKKCEDQIDDFAILKDAAEKKILIKSVLKKNILKYISILK